MTLIDLVAAEYVVRRVLLPGLNLMIRAVARFENPGGLVELWWA
jgi:hypothetical protein